MTTLLIITIILFIGCIAFTVASEETWNGWYTFGAWVCGIAFAIIGFIYFWNATAYRDIPQVEKTAPAFLESLGYNEIKYIGFGGAPALGGQVYYQARDNNDYLYKMHVYEWRGELMVSSLECMNAVSNQESE